MSLAVDIRNLTIPFMLLFAKIGIDKGKTKEYAKKKDGKPSKRGGCGCRLRGGGDVPQLGAELIGMIHSVKDL